MNKCLPQLRAVGNRCGAIFWACAASVWVALNAVPAMAADSAVILMYHRFGESAYPSTNIRIEQFEAHLAELRKGSYTVLPVPEILARIRDGEPLPDRAVGITIDDAFLSVYREAFPRLTRAGFPFTLFVATEPIDQRLRDFMTWDQIREMREAGVTIAGHSHSHLHMVTAGPSASRADVEKSHRRFEAELGFVPRIFAYPFGEASLEIMKATREMGIEFAFGQNSAVLHKSSDPLLLPRFPFNETYGDADRFRLIANALPLPVSGVVPADPLLHDNPPAFGFTVADGIENLDALNCYSSASGKVKIDQLGPRRIEVRFDAPFPVGRSRVNCTLPGPDGRWRWFGVQFYREP